MSEHSSPALNQRAFSFKRKLTKDHYPITSGENSANISKQTSDILVENQGDGTGKNSNQEDVTIRKFTSLLTLNRYNKIYTEEFREEDIEIMNINSTVKRYNEKLRKISAI